MEMSDKFAHISLSVTVNTNKNFSPTSDAVRKEFHVVLPAMMLDAINLTHVVYQLFRDAILGWDEKNEPPAGKEE